MFVGGRLYRVWDYRCRKPQLYNVPVSGLGPGALAQNPRKATLLRGLRRYMICLYQIISYYMFVDSSCEADVDHEFVCCVITLHYIAL